MMVSVPLRFVLIIASFCGMIRIVGAQDIRVEYLPEPPEVEFSTEGGLFQEAVTVELYCEGAEIFYTTDGQYPTRNSHPYDKPLHVISTTVVRAVAWLDGSPGPVAAHTYFIGEPKSACAVVSLTTEPDLLFDAEHGLYMKGSDYDGENHMASNANFLTHDEITGNCEIFDSDGTTLWRSYCGLRLFGGISRFFPQKSLTIVARKRYGKKRIKRRIFPNGPEELKFLVLRNSGSDFGKSHFRDLFMTGLTDNLDVDKQEGRPAHVYINGHYWGMYNIREKINRYFIADHHRVDKDSLDLLEHRMSLKQGSTVEYRKLLSFLRTHDLTQPEAYARLQTLMDVSNFIDHQLTQIYIDNRDAGGNIRFWRSQEPDGRWRWILYDTDWGFALHDPKAWLFNSLAFHTRPDGPHWPNPPWSTFILRKLLEQEAFRTEFAGRMAIYLSTCFREETVEARLDSLIRLYGPELPRHFKRWRLSESRWVAHTDRMREFGKKRPEAIRRFFREAFELGPDVQTDISAAGGGRVLINGHHTLENEELCGIWFAGLPMSIKADALPGHRFIGWDGLPAGLNPTLKEHTLIPTEPMDIRAVFEPWIHPASETLIFNEISCYDTGAEDWIELYNNGETAIDVSGWIIADYSHQFTMPQAVIPPSSYLVVCQDAAAFAQAYPREYQFVGNLGFGINKYSECLWMYSKEGAFVDSFCYRIQPTDSAFTLSLLLPELDNSKPENWEIRSGPGSPNSANPFYYQTTIRKQQQRWMRTGAGIGMLLSAGFLWFRLRASSRL